MKTTNFTTTRATIFDRLAARVKMRNVRKQHELRMQAISECRESIKAERKELIPCNLPH